jgi:hypothetical protein
MADKLTLDQTARVLDKRRLRQSVAALQARLGLPHDPTATGESAQAVTLASGINPADRVLSREVIRARREDKE